VFHLKSVTLCWKKTIFL